MATITIAETGIRSYSLTTSIHLSQQIEEVFSFFADARNLEVLTPASLRFKILTPLPIAMKPGLLIDYRLSLYGIPFKWQSKITIWEPPFRFTDEQIQGPYQLWIHEHKFECVNGTSLVSDTVHYTLKRPVFIRRFVESDLKKIFAYRHTKLKQTFQSLRCGSRELKWN